MFVLYTILASILALVCAGALAINISKKSSGNEKMKEISSHIQEGAMAFLSREYRYLAIYVIVVAIVLYAIYSFTISAILTSISFIIGAVLSASAGFIGMKIATKSNVRTTEAARSSLSDGLKIAFSSGSVMGLSVVGLGLLGLSILYYIFSTYFGFENPTNIIFGFSFGASSIALFARVGGGIYTKAADVGADLVGKIEKNIPEDDPRNPAVIADNVGDDVGDVAGMGADLYESYVGSIVAAMALGFIAFSVEGLLVPLMLAAIGIIASIIGIVFVKSTKSERIHYVLRNGTILSSILMAIGSYILVTILIPVGVNIFLSMISGLVAGILIGYLTEYYTSYDYKPTQELSYSSKTGAATTIISGWSLGNKSTALPILVLSAAIFISYYFSGLYGIAIAGVGMLSTLGITLAVDAYGPVADNAGGIAEMAGLPKSVRKRTDALDAAGNTTAAMGKGFAIGSAGLTALALFSTYAAITGIKTINILNSNVMIGLLIGAMLPFLFSSLSMSAVGKAAQEMIEEVRRQFKQIKGLMSGKAKGDYKRCVDISTNAAIKRMVAPGLLAVLAPIVIGLVLGKEAVGGLLAGSLVSGVVLAIMMANTGGAWDNAKKLIEKSGKKGTDEHKASIVGDTVGDPLKDTAGPSLNILIKLMSIVALIFAVVF